MAIFFRIARTAQRLRALPTGFHNGNLFSRMKFLLPATFKIVIAGFLDK